MPVLVYDGHCSLCRRGANRLVRMGGRAVALESFHDPGVLSRYGALSREECMRELKLVHDDGRIEGGVSAVAGVLGLSSRWRWLASLLRAPGLRGVAEAGYRAIARHRYRLSGRRCPPGTCVLHAGAPVSGRDSAEE
jgi:predicted DCC family thiol-disulfide oxidoreductase YuxK